MKPQYEACPLQKACKGVFTNISGCGVHAFLYAVFSPEVMCDSLQHTQMWDKYRPAYLTLQRQGSAQSPDVALQEYDLVTQVKADDAAALQRREIGLAAQLEAARLEVYAGREALSLKQLELDSAQEAAAERRRAAEQEAEELAQERQKRQCAEEDMKVNPPRMRRCHVLPSAFASIPHLSQARWGSCKYAGSERKLGHLYLLYGHVHLLGTVEAFNFVRKSAHRQRSPSWQRAAQVPNQAAAPRPGRWRTCVSACTARCACASCENWVADPTG